jgi:hypothetical protein
MDRTTTLQFAQSRTQELIKEAQQRRSVSQVRSRRSIRRLGPLRILRLQRA